jgi:TetR/AcrR family transcriptional repressor of mexJK operon
VVSSKKPSKRSLPADQTGPKVRAPKAAPVKIGRGRPRGEDATVINEKLLRAALQEFLLHGYGKASLSRIVNAAEASKSTLYSRYASKEELFLAIIRDQIQRLSPSASLQTPQGPMALEQGLIAYGSHTLKHSLLGELRGVDRLIYSESYQFPELAQAARARTAQGVQRVEAFIRDCAEREAIPCRNPRVVAENYIFMIRGWYADIVLSNREVTAAECDHWVKTAVQTLVRGRTGW